LAGFNCSLFDFIHAATASTHSEICDTSSATAVGAQEP